MSRRRQVHFAEQEEKQLPGLQVVVMRMVVKMVRMMVRMMKMVRMMVVMKMMKRMMMRMRINKLVTIILMRRRKKR